MIACISPCITVYEESMRTLSYAARAANIESKPVIQGNVKDEVRGNMR